MDRSYSLEEIKQKSDEILRLFSGHNIANKIYTWTELSRMQTRELCKILKDNGFIIFLYELNKNSNVLSGHWMIILDRNEAVEVFDSHGSLIAPLEWYRDQNVLNHVDNSVLTIDKLEPILSNKLFDCGYRYVDWNTKELQKKKNGISTCGRWVLLRLLFHKLFPQNDVDNFCDYMFALSKKMKKSTDEIIMLTGL